MNYGLAKMAKDKAVSEKEHKQNKQGLAIGTIGAMSTMGAAQSKGIDGGLGSAKGAVRGASVGALATLPALAIMDYQHNKKKGKAALAKTANMNDEPPEEREANKARRQQAMVGAGLGVAAGGTAGGLIGGHIGANRAIQQAQEPAELKAKGDINRNFDSRSRQAHNDIGAEKANKKQVMHIEKGLNDVFQMSYDLKSKHGIDSAGETKVKLDQSQARLENAYQDFLNHGKDDPRFAQIEGDRVKGLADFKTHPTFLSSIDDARMSGYGRGTLVGGAAGALGLGALGGMMGRNRERQPE